MLLFDNLLSLSLEAAPWLVFGLLLAGIIRALIPDSGLQRWLGGKGWKPAVSAAFIGAPLPLCSCGVLPVALSLRRAGASRGTTVSFLISTPENGVDSVALSYALLGPVMAIVRPVAGIILAVAAGILTLIGDKEDSRQKATESGSCSSCCSSEQKKAPAESVLSRITDGIRYSFGKLWRDIMGWLAFGIFIAAVVQTFVSAEAIAEFGHSSLGLIAMLFIGIPVYICATASTPIAAALITSGLSPGAALVFLLAGPATNLGSVALLKNELGSRAVAIYLGTIAIGSLLMGYGLNLFLEASGLNVVPGTAHDHVMQSSFIQGISLLLLVALSAPVIWQRIRRAPAVTHN